MPISFVTRPDVHGKTSEQAIQILCDRFHETAVLIMELNNRLEKLESTVTQLQQGC